MLALNLQHACVLCCVCLFCGLLQLAYIHPPVQLHTLQRCHVCVGRVQPGVAQGRACQCGVCAGRTGQWQDDDDGRHGAVRDCGLQRTDGTGGSAVASASATRTLGGQGSAYGAQGDCRLELRAAGADDRDGHAGA